VSALAKEFQLPLKIVSACLVGIECRYNCEHRERREIVEMLKSGEILPVCPEQLAGLATPRPAAEVQAGKVIDNTGKDITDAYEAGAHEALKLAKLVGATQAYLKTKSPMCGHGKIYDGSFSGKLTNGDGIFAKLLQENGIKIIAIE